MRFALMLVMPCIGLSPYDTASSQASSPPVRYEDYRVASVAYRLAVAGLPECAAKASMTGLVLQYLSEFDAGDRAEAARRFRLDRGPGVVAVVNGSPAANTGMQPGDTIVAINDVSAQSFLIPLQRKPNRGAIDSAHRQIVERIGNGAAVTVLRGMNELRLSVGSVSGCAAGARLARSRQLNAFASGGNAIITTALLDMIKSDDELAIVVAHEMAHVILGHSQNGSRPSLIRAREEAADRLGLKLAWLAGYDIAASIDFWSRFGKARGPRFLNFHPNRAARERMVQQMLLELGPQRPQLREGPFGEGGL